MTIEELHELVERTLHMKAEGQCLEVKAATQGCPRRLYDTLSSFSNQDGGGIILFGLDERLDFSAVGVYDLQDLQKKVTEQCLQMEPPVRAVFTMCEFHEMHICAAEIPGIDLTDRPCYYKGAGRLNGSYVRVGDADLPMTEYELYSLEAFRKHQRDDERIVERATIGLMDSDNIQFYIQRMRSERPMFSRLSNDQTFELLNITINEQFTLAAVMNFGLFPQGFFPQLAVTAIVVPGAQIGDTDSAEARFLDNRRIEGNLKTMLEESMGFCLRNMKRKTIIHSKDGRREDRTEYPPKAIREAILNALIHRDYSPLTEGTPIQVNFFSDRLEIHSPGGLYGRITVEQLGYVKPDLRNPSLAVMAEALLGAENRYSGIPTIRKEMEEYGLEEPIFENRRGEFVVILKNSVRIEEKPQETPLLTFCSTPRSRKEIAEYLGVQASSFMMRQYVLPLVQEGKLRLTMPDRPKSKNQRYVINEENN